MPSSLTSRKCRNQDLKYIYHLISPLVWLKSQVWKISTRVCRSQSGWSVYTLYTTFPKILVIPARWSWFGSLPEPGPLLPQGFGTTFPSFWKILLLHIVHSSSSFNSTSSERFTLKFKIRLESPAIGTQGVRVGVSDSSYLSANTDPLASSLSRALDHLFRILHLRGHKLRMPFQLSYLVDSRQPVQRQPNFMGWPGPPPTIGAWGVWVHDRTQISLTRRVTPWASPEAPEKARW